MNEKKYFTYFNREEAKAYIGKTCRFSNSPINLERGAGVVGVLGAVNEGGDRCFDCVEQYEYYEYCTPVETRIRPYNSFEEMVKDAVKHGLYDSCFMIDRKETGFWTVALKPTGVVGTKDAFFSFDKMAKEYTWFDGAPCGVEEEV